MRTLNRAVTIGSYAVVALLCCLFSPSTLSGQLCSLIGEQATLDVTSDVGRGGTAMATVQAGPVEFNPAPGDLRFSVDVESTSIRMFNNTASTTVVFDNATTYKVTIGGPASITGVSVTVNSVTGFTAANVSFTANSVTLDVTGSTWPGGSSVVVTLQLVCPTNMPTNTPTNTLTNTPTNTPTSTPTNTPTNTPAGVATNTPTSTPVPSQVPVVPTLNEWGMLLFGLLIAAAGLLLVRRR